jgi:hypothetical protein
VGSHKLDIVLFSSSHSAGERLRSGALISVAWNALNPL